MREVIFVCVNCTVITEKSVCSLCERFIPAYQRHYSSLVEGDVLRECRFCHSLKERYGLKDGFGMVFESGVTGKVFPMDVLEDPFLSRFFCGDWAECCSEQDFEGRVLAF